VIRPALEDTRVVVNTHYVDTSIAFHGAGQGLDGDRIFRTSLWATRGLLPDLTVVVDSPVTAAPRGVRTPRRCAGPSSPRPRPHRTATSSSPGELLDTHSPDGLVSPVVRRRLATLLATRYPAAGEGDPAPQVPATPGATSTAAAERTGRSVG
jgi:dTMP kinase